LQLVNVAQAMRDIAVEFFAMVVVVRQRAVNLGQRQIGVVPPDVVCVKAIRQVVEHNFYDLCVRTGKHRHIVQINGYVRIV